jgi:predicted histidine transporter YuiF (NhaC family)
MKNKKVGKYLLLAGLILVLVAVGAINYIISSNAGKDKAAAEATASDIEGAMQADDLSVMAGLDNFTAYKAERESRRDTEVAVLNSIIDNEKSSQEDIDDATEQKMAIVVAMEAEANIEGTLMASCGFNNVIVTVKKGSVNVLIDEVAITAEEAAKILEIVQDETGEPAQNIKILLPQNKS